MRLGIITAGQLRKYNPSLVKALMHVFAKFHALRIIKNVVVLVYPIG
jgi:hypothetical protein